MASISSWYGRLGNNLQQISNAIYFCQKNELNFHCPEHPLIRSFDIEFGKNSELASRFFFFKGDSKDFECDTVELNCSRRRLLLQYVVPNFKFFVGDAFFEDTLVIHLRSGDVFAGYEPPNTYVQNPLFFFEKLIEQFEDVLVVTEPDQKNPVIEELKKNKKVMIQSTSLINDFVTLLRTQNLASSGVGSFPLAAALCSKNIKNFYYTNLFLEEHLNPRMLGQLDITLHQTDIDLNSYIKIGEWKNTKQQRELMIQYYKRDKNEYRP